MYWGNNPSEALLKQSVEETLCKGNTPFDNNASGVFLVRLPPALRVRDVYPLSICDRRPRQSLLRANQVSSKQ